MSEARARGPEPGALLEGGIGSPVVPARLATLCAAFELGLPERQLIATCLGCELGREEPGPQGASGAGDFPTLASAAAAIPNLGWHHLSPVGALRRWHLIVPIGEGPYAHRPLRVDERILHFLMGVEMVDERLQAFSRAVQADPGLAPQAAVHRILDLWRQPRRGPGLIQICGPGPDGEAAATAVAEALGAQMLLIRLDLLPADPQELRAIRILCEREARLTGAILTFSGDTHAGRPTALNLLAALCVPGLLLSTEPMDLGASSPVRIDLPPPTSQERRQRLRRALGPAGGADLDGDLAHIAEAFLVDSWTGPAIQATVTARLREVPPAPLGQIVWESCREQLRTRLEHLAQHVEPVATWDDLILPAPQRRILEEMAAHQRQRMTVFDTWGFGHRGSGSTALFAGPSGTGKTLAAEIIAHELGVDLFKVDLSQVVSKYIGETEKNLARVFEAAERAGGLLLFDEADALFGKRTEVKDSHDRYANVEVSYLLQRMEAYRGLAVLTTNLREAVDSAFLRRIRFVVTFPFPGVEERQAIWGRVFPPAMPQAGLAPEKLARLQVTGGSIRNIAVSAAFIAAERGEPVGMHHLRQAAESECAKLDRTARPAEIGGWV